jgi:hypothetical protein
LKVLRKYKINTKFQIFKQGLKIRIRVPKLPLLQGNSIKLKIKVLKMVRDGSHRVAR